MTGAEQQPARPAQVSAPGSQGIQVGGTQYNQWVSRPPDPAALEVLSARAGADYLARQSRDDAAMVLARAPAAVAVATVAALLQSDEGLAISLLTHLNPAKAAALLAAMTSPAAWLADLLNAAEAVARCAEGARAGLGAATGQLVRAAESDRRSHGFRQEYQHGTVYWCARGGAQVVAGDIGARHAAAGGTAGLLGFPVEPERQGDDSGRGSCQAFEGQDSARQHGAVAWRLGTDVHVVAGEVLREYRALGGPDGPLGYPVSEDTEPPVGTAIWQRFEGGAIYSQAVRVPLGPPGPRPPAATSGSWAGFQLRPPAPAAHRARAVWGAIQQCLDRHGGAGWIGYPRGDREPAATSPAGTTGESQGFANAAIIYDSALGTFVVAERVAALHQRLGGTEGWLGFPVSDAIDVPHADGELPRHLQAFEGGTVFCAGDAFAVPKATMELFDEPGGIGRQLGFPVSAVEPGPGGARVQLFEHGVVTTRGGLAQAWAAPGWGRDRGWLALSQAPPAYRQAGFLLRADSGCLAVTFSPDGALLGAGTEEGTALLWAHDRGPKPAGPDWLKAVAQPADSAVRSLDGQAGSVRAVAFSPDGTMLAAAGKDLMVRLWDVQQGICALTLPGLEDWAHCCAFSPDGSLIAAGGRDHAVRVWALPFRRAFKAVLARSFSGTTQRVLAAAFSPDGELLAEGGGGAAVRLWDVRRGTLVNALSGHTGRVQSVAFSPDGRTLASAGDRTVRLWDLRDGAVIRSHACPEGFATSVAFSADGALIAAGGTDAAVRLWSAEDGRPCGVLRGHDAAVRSVAFSPAGPLLASAGDDRTVRLWEPAS